VTVTQTTFLHDPSDVLDYSYDFTAWLGNGEAITAQTVTCSDAGITLNPSAHTVTQAAGVVTVWVTGGVPGTRYDLVCHITTDTGRQTDRTMRLQVVQR
jgi:hypothetical protein